MTSKFTTTHKKPLPPSKLDWKPKAYMKKAVALMLKNSSHGLLLDPGLGKTSISLAAGKVLRTRKFVRRILVVAPLRPCYLVWPLEIAKWKDFSELTYKILHGPRKDKDLREQADIYIINPEGLQWLFSQKDFAKLGFDMLIIDESTKFKHTNTKRFKLLRKYLPTFKRRYILTGSPAANGLMDLFGQIFILDGGAALGKYITHYRNQYFYATGFGGYTWKLQPGADKLIQKAIKPLVLRLDADDHLELPEVVINPIYIDLEGEAKEVYEEMEEELYTRIMNKEVIAQTAAVASGKCSQIANGGLYYMDDDGVAEVKRKAWNLHMLKTDVVVDMLEELNGNPMLVAYEYGHDLDRLRMALGKNVPYIGGGVSDKRAVELERLWNSGQLPVLLGQPASMAHGLNFQNAGNHVMWHSLTWNFEHYDQFNKRIRRQGSKHKRVFIHHVIARGTVDELKVMALNNKYRTQRDLFDALKVFLQARRG